jgi:hypothetical protein
MGGSNLRLNLSVRVDPEAARAFRYVPRETDASRIASEILADPDVFDAARALAWARHRYTATAGYLEVQRARPAALRWEPLPRIHALERRWRKRVRKLSAEMVRVTSRAMSRRIAAEFVRQFMAAAVVCEVSPEAPAAYAETYQAAMTPPDSFVGLSGEGAYRARTGIEVASDQSRAATHTCSATIRALDRSSVCPLPPEVSVYMDGDRPTHVPRET